jgi:hypothetical protein
MTDRWEFGQVLQYISDKDWKVMVIEDRGTEFSFICVSPKGALWRVGQITRAWQFDKEGTVRLRSLREWWSPVE